MPSWLNTNHDDRLPRSCATWAGAVAYAKAVMAAVECEHRVPRPGRRVAARFDEAVCEALAAALCAGARCGIGRDEVFARMVRRDDEVPADDADGVAAMTAMDEEAAEGLARARRRRLAGDAEAEAAAAYARLALTVNADGTPRNPGSRRPRTAVPATTTAVG